ncbi:hypothetical protein NKR19_g2838 [Coniochaeta hoffmannii]|uniref:Uncharacterized protein n=1 Tax=Coniochaeta hoffmannii TaxID=91930 RepID=A0AA38SHX2_9PEZI|nr:hypothetical protein NKR19_g2838 [Coniochaeta hoffmannii]
MVPSLFPPQPSHHPISQSVATMCFETPLTPLCPTCLKQDGEPGLEGTKCPEAKTSWLGHGKCSQVPSVKQKPAERYLNDYECFACARKMEKKKEAEEAKKQAEKEDAERAEKEWSLARWGRDLNGFEALIRMEEIRLQRERARDQHRLLQKENWAPVRRTAEQEEKDED